MLRSRLTLGLAAAAALFAAACGDDDDPLANRPPAPAPVGAASINANTARFTWRSVQSATGYVLRRAVGANGNFAVIDRPAAQATDTVFTDAGLEPQTLVRYQVAAVVGTDTSDFSVEVSATTGQAGAVTANIGSNVTSDRTLFADTTYILQQVIFVANGATLTIQPGTRIVGPAPTTGQPPTVTALVVLRGSRIVANGTASRPIVMTSGAPEGQPRFPGDWGGLVIVGNAQSNRTGRVVVEGPTPVDTVSWNAGTPAGDAESSGSLRYVRVEFAGAAVRTNEELNSFSFYAVGRGTTLEYLQALRGLDDHFEWFGGTVDGRFLVSYEAGDDHFDSAEGYRGRNQYLIGLQTGPRISPRPGNPGVLSAEQSGFESDGCGTPSGTCLNGFDSTPFSEPVFANFTIIGPGPGVLPARPNGDGGLGANIRRGAGGAYINGIFARWPEAAFSIFDPQTDTRLTQDSLDILNVLSAENPRTFDAVGATNRFGQETKFASANIRTVATAANALFTAVPAANVEIANDAALDFTPSATSEARTGGTGATLPAPIAARAASFFGAPLQGTAFVGAVDPAATAAGAGPTSKWFLGWTSYRRN